MGTRLHRRSVAPRCVTDLHVIRQLSGTFPCQKRSSERDRAAQHQHPTDAPPPVRGVAEGDPPHRHRELLGGQHIVGLGDSRGVAGQINRAVVNRRIPIGDPVLLGRQHVVRRLGVEGRSDRWDAELLGSEHVTSPVFVAGTFVCHGLDHPKTARKTAVSSDGYTSPP